MACNGENFLWIGLFFVHQLIAVIVNEENEFSLDAIHDGSSYLRRCHDVESLNALKSTSIPLECLSTEIILKIHLLISNKYSKVYNARSILEIEYG